MHLAIRDPVLQSAIIVVFLIFISAAHAEKWNYRQTSKINWREYNADAFTEARQKNKPLYIFIYSDLCSWCKKFETETLETRVIRQLLQNQFIPVLVNQATQAELAKKLGIKLVPANILITHDGKRLLRFYGFLTTQALSEALDKTLLSWKKGEIPDEEFSDQSTCCPVPGSH